MATECEDGELWLPAELLCDDFFRDEKPKEGEPLVSNLDSPVESVTTGTESDEDVEYMAGLTQRMARYSLQDDDGDAMALALGHSKAIARSPQSTLCPWSASNKGSPNGPSLVSSPSSSSPLQQRGKEDAGNLLYEAAGQVMRMRRLSDLGRGQSLYERGFISPAENPSPAPKSSCYASGPFITDHQIQAAHFYHMKRQQAMKQQLAAPWGRQNRATGVGGGHAEGRCGPCGRPLDLPPSAWPPLIKPSPPQQEHNPTRAVLLNNSGVRKESAGTGVFLPRTSGNRPEPRKKAECSTVLVPDRVVQALNLSMEEFAALPRFPGGFVLNRDVLIGRSSAVVSHQKRKHHLGDDPTTAAAAAWSGVLPQEWTY
ncbi:hypothetical protein Cni_G13413 [Canna indica]|uniref:Uncharacterized protein n=1 Tax=Canna indica TaxID=4628 RepID=A0AAQ3KFJ2_9LILI|nr:hypothetical protein Cni_G13413 [Canna indica]